MTATKDRPTMEVEVDLLPSDIESDLSTTTRELLAHHCPPARIIAMYDGDHAVARDVWRSLADDLGIAGLMIPELHGGHGASAREAGSVLEELGRACAPTPFLTSAVIGASLLSRCEDPAAGGVLKAMAAGESVVALLVPWSTGPDDAVPMLEGIAGRVSGTVRNVAGAIESDFFIVPIRGADGLELRLVHARDCQVLPVASLDMTRQVADVVVDCTFARRLSPDADPAVRSSLLLGAALLASEQAGLARWCLEETVSYLKVRRQFGRTVGGFQAIKHRLADLYAQVESASAAARYAAVSIAAQQDADVAGRVAAAYCADVAVLAAEETVQLHGGIGMTWEHPAHLYLKRAKADQIALGSTGSHRHALAALLNL